MATSYNKVFAVFFISALVMMASFQTSEAISECAKSCMPSCMEVDGSTLGVCEEACESGCTQLNGDAAAVKAKFEAKIV
uniref:Thionin-like protein 2 n=1 Tax=Nelumbo nucifera TaxID=4432 RepID=A0A822Y2T7_NELNU|nr:TPA_asm: hypothetical protein HUJ06_028225 [Nelumbo nucifera]